MGLCNTKCDVLLVSVPWPELGTGSIQLATLKPVLAENGISTESCSLYLDWLDFLARRIGGLAGQQELFDDYQKIATRLWTIGLGDWIFSVPPVVSEIQGEDRYIQFAQSKGVDEHILQTAKRMRNLVPEYLDRCAEEIGKSGCKIVGFTSSFSQNTAALALSGKIKERAPDIEIVFGGANCDGPMGAVLIQQFPWIKAVVRGEAETLICGLIADILSGSAIKRRPGLCFREDSEVHILDQANAENISMDKLPVPDYDEYFDRLRGTPFDQIILSKTRILFETARGCWWGQKKHCTFCGLNGSSMAFRSKSGDLAAEQVLELSKRYERLNFEIVDNILDLNYFKTFLPRLKSLNEVGYDFEFFYETKSNLTDEQVRLLRDAGVSRIQPGIESLSTPILQLMKKGVSAIQNIQLLKLAAHYGIKVTWNIIYGFPMEDPKEYERMAQLIPSLTHLRPPALIPLSIQRFSPYHQNPAQFGLSLVGPAPYYKFIYEMPEEMLNDLAYEFTFEASGEQDPEAYSEPLKAAIVLWEEAFFSGSSLHYERGPGFLRIFECRRNLPMRIYKLGEVESAIYLACNEAQSPHKIWTKLDFVIQRVVTEEEIRHLLDEMEKNRLVCSEGGKYLALAIARERPGQNSTLN